MKPNLFIIGAMKSGTSSLHRYLGEHPEIFMCEPKEPAFFAAEASRVADEAHYLELFASAGSVKYVGESSTHYSKYPRFPDVVERITGFAPHARFIYLMRDPVERSISHYWHMVRWHGERRGILKAMQAEPDFVDFSNYPLQLKQWMKECSTEQLFVDSFECMLRDPKAFCSRVFEWLEVDPGFQPKGTGEVHNDTPQRVTRHEHQILNRLRYSRFWNAVGPKIPKIFRKVALNASQQNLDLQDAHIQSEIEGARRYLREQLLPSVQELRDLTGCHFNEWKNFVDHKRNEEMRNASNR